MKKEIFHCPGKTRGLALALLLGLSPAWAKDFLVASAQEFDTALTSVQPGDTLVFKSGAWHDVKLKFHAQGKQNQPVTLRAETPGGAIFDRASELKIDGSHLVVSGFKFQNSANVTEIVTPYAVTVASVVTFTKDSSDCRLTETAIVDSGAGVTTYVHLEPGSRSNRVDHCWFSNQGNIGVTFYIEVHPTLPNEHRVNHNYFGDRKPGVGNRWETIRVGHSDQQDFVSGTTVAYNYFYRCNGENECVSNKSTGNNYLYNSFVETRGQLTLRHGSRARVEGNYFFAASDPRSEGLRVIGSDHVVINNYFKGVRDAVVVYSGEVNPEPKGYLPVNNALIAFNTLEDCAGNFILGSSGRAVPPKNLRIAYNLVQAKSGQVIQSQSAGIGVSYEGNIMFGGDPPGSEQAGIDRQKPILSQDEWGRVFPDAAKSPVPVNLGHFPEVQKDIDGEIRTDSSNVGAIGIRSARPLYPLSPREVGPLWMGRTGDR